MTEKIVRRPGRRFGLGWISRGALAIVLAGTAAAAVVPVASAQAAPTRALKSRSVVVVHVQTRHHFGKILVTARRGHALYVLPHGRCTAASGCLSVWPRLVLPKGKTIPRCAACLGTARFGTHHRLQVTYHGKRLYTFADDSGHSVNGNNFQGFKVAKRIRCSTMM